MPVLATKLMVLAAALAVIAAAAPADAKTPKHPHKKVVVAHRVKAEPRCRGDAVFACGPLYYNGGEYLGDDPDPNIRFQLWRDLGAHFGAPD